MEKEGVFNLEKQVTVWYQHVNSQTGITQADAEELKTHLLDLTDDLKATGLDDEEAFWVASKRMGSIYDWRSDYLEANKPVMQLRKSLIILAGVLAYFLLYHFINCSSKLAFIILLHYQVDGYIGINWISKYLIAIHLMVIVFVSSIYLFEQKTVSFIENIRLKPKYALYLLLTSIFLSLLNTCLYPIIKNMTLSDRMIFSHLHHLFIYLDYTFPLLICASFTILYAKYYKKAKI